MARTFADLYGDVRLRIQDPSPDNRFTLVEKKAAINLMYRRFCVATTVVRELVTFAQDTGAVYEPTGTKRVVSITGFPQSASVGSRLIPTDADAAFDRNPNWETETGTPVYYLYPWLVEADNKKLRVQPFPAPAAAWAGLTAYAVGDYVVGGSYTHKCITAGTSSVASGPTTTSNDFTDGTVHWDQVSDSISIALVDLKVPCVMMGADLSADADIPVIPEQWHDALADGAVAYLLKNDGPYQDAGRASLFEASYLAAEAEGKAMASRMFSSNPVVVPYRNL